VSSSLGWGKGFGEECAGMYRKRKKRRSDADKEEIVGEAITRVMELLRVVGVPIPDGLCPPKVYTIDLLTTQLRMCPLKMMVKMTTQLLTTQRGKMMVQHCRTQ
jgi:hypothetical protein